MPKHDQQARGGERRRVSPTAAAAARRIIRELELADETATWRAIAAIVDDECRRAS